MLPFYVLGCVTTPDSVTIIFHTFVMSRAATESIATQCDQSRRRQVAYVAGVKRVRGRGNLGRHAGYRLVEFSVSKWLKLTQFHLFTSPFDLKKQLCNGKTDKKYEKRAFRVQISTFVRFELEVFTQLPPAYHKNS